MKGIRLSASQGKYIIEGKKKMIVLSEKPPKHFYNTDVAIIEDEIILGTLQLKGEAGPLKPGSVRSPLRDLHGLTDKDWDERAEKDPKFNQNVYTITFEDVKPWDEPVPYDGSKAEGVYWVSSIDSELEKHSRFKCMNCDEPPTIEVLWAEGKAHAWFCEEHFEEWKVEVGGEEINASRKIDGEASEAWEESLSEEKEEDLEGASTSDDVLREEPMEIIEDTEFEEETPEEVAEDMETKPPFMLIHTIEDDLEQETTPEVEDLEHDVPIETPEEEELGPETPEIELEPLEVLEQVEEVEETPAIDIPEDEPISSIVSRLEIELEKLVEKELKTFTEGTKLSSVQREYVEKKIELVELMKKILSRGEKVD